MVKKSPVVEEINYNSQSMLNFVNDLENSSKEESTLMLRFPTVYIINEKESDNRYVVYVGETTDIQRRTEEHLNSDPKLRSDWEKLSNSKNAMIYIIGHQHFNKSLTLDIENRLMLYMSGIDSVSSLNNRRMNQQNEYYTSNELNVIFSGIWSKLRQKNPELFPLERIIEDSAIFKASPFHKLTEEQINAKNKIMLHIKKVIINKEKNNLIIVNGEAGAGKTVLMSSIFYDLFQMSADSNENLLFRDMTIFLLVNHDQQLKVYEQITQKLGVLSKRNPKIVSKPTTFINNHSPQDPVDVVIVDEAHLLWTQGKQSYRGRNQLKDIIERARVVVAVFDQNQILSTEQYWENDDFLNMMHDVNLRNNLIQLDNQMRIDASSATVNWIRDLVDKRQIGNIPADNKYDLKVFKNPQELYDAIIEKSQHLENGISRLTATFDWEYIDKKKPKNGDKYWMVKVGDFELPWNLQLEQTSEQKRANRVLSWAEQNQSIGEVGSTFTVQGFDLNYSGVIIGPSVKYREGKIVFDKEASKNSKSTRKRTLKDKSKQSFSDFLLKNELNVLLTRGVHGLYLYAVDSELQTALLNAQSGSLKN